MQPPPSEYIINMYCVAGKRLFAAAVSPTRVPQIASSCFALAVHQPMPCAAHSSERNSFKRKCWTPSLRNTLSATDKVGHTHPEAQRAPDRTKKTVDVAQCRKGEVSLYRRAPHTPANIYYLFVQK